MNQELTEYNRCSLIVNLEHLVCASGKYNNAVRRQLGKALITKYSLEAIECIEELQANLRRINVWQPKALETFLQTKRF